MSGVRRQMDGGDEFNLLRLERAASSKQKVHTTGEGNTRLRLGF